MGMTVRRIFTTVLVAASVVLVAPAAHAGSAAVIESANGTERVWHQTRWDGEPTITEDFRNTPNQLWDLRGDGTIRNIGSGLCAEVVEDRVVAGRPCNGDPEQQWRLRGDDNQLQIQNVKHDNCATYEGEEQQLLVRECDWDRINQRWYINN